MAYRCLVHHVTLCTSMHNLTSSHEGWARKTLPTAQSLAEPVKFAMMFSALLDLVSFMHVHPALDIMSNTHLAQLMPYQMALKHHGNHMVSIRRTLH